MTVTQVVIEGAAALLSVSTSAALAYLTPRLKKLIDAHVSAKQAEILNLVVDGLPPIIEGVVQRFNQLVVIQAKQEGAWTPELAKAVKADAIEAIKSQGAALIALAEKVGGDIMSFISDQIDKYVEEHHIPNKQPNQQPDQQPTEQPAQSA